MKKTAAREDYLRAFEKERHNIYNVVDAYERDLGFAIKQELLHDLALPLACPVKVNPPNWQHGRIVYTTLRKYLADKKPDAVFCLDIGTAKGFSAICAQAAIMEGNTQGKVVSIDVIDPDAKVRRNTIAETDGLKTLKEIIGKQHWGIYGKRIEFTFAKSTTWLALHPGRIHFAFVDGKHNYQTVKEEINLLSYRQAPGDIIIFDDCQYEGVYRAVLEARDYDITWMELGLEPNRQYAIGTRR